MNALRYGLTPKMKPISPRKSALVAALDVGSSKVVCMIGRLRPHAPQQVLTRRSHGIEIVGFGHTVARGMKAGSVVNLGQAEEAIRQAVDSAERMAGVEIESVVLSLSAGRQASELFAAEIDIVGSTISDHDIARVLAAGSRHSLRDGRAILHSLPVGYSIDGVEGVRDPRGMLGSRFGVDMHVATIDIAPARNLMLAVERCHLDIEAMVASAYVAGLSVLADDEADLGSIVVDMGAGTTSLAAFLGGRLVHIDGFTLGGHHVTMDIARGLNARVSDAERIKTLYGTVLSGGSDERDMITVPPLSDEEREQAQLVSRATLANIIKPRVEEILEMVRDRLTQSSLGGERRGHVILTGGASQLTGLPDLAARILGRQVRVGRPLGIAGAPDVAKGAAFAVAAGLLVYPQAAHLEHFESRRRRQLMTGSGGYFARVGLWLRESF
ncbi:MAG TPA: cell division protein FtsA [Xanthobacteraceae bacterium]|nr:cell division protein FtsA [Xanthobacteraceae bacterium]HUC51947.1 cell division protein FtsA [Xanthobacteraceae bacterium]